MSILTAHPTARTFGFGDRAVCFMQVDLRPEADDRTASVEDALSWGSLEWWVGGQNLCAHYERGALISNVSWYLLPFFEWLTSSWDYLFHEQRPPVSNEGINGWESLTTTNNPDRFGRLPAAASRQAEAENYAWSQRHSLWSSREGGLFPDVIIRRDRDQIEISWGGNPPPGAPNDYRFVSNGGAVRLPPQAVADALYSVLKDAVFFLRGADSQSKRLRDLARQVVALARDNRRDKWLAIMAGLGTRSNLWKDSWKRLQEHLRGSPVTALDAWFGKTSKAFLVLTGNCEGALMFGSASPTLSANDVLTLAKSLVTDSWRDGNTDELAKFAKNIPVAGKPYQHGYDLATDWAEESGLWASSDKSVDIEDHLRAHNVNVLEIELADQNIRGVAVAKSRTSPVILVNSSSPWNASPTGRRFTLAHELCHLLYDRGLGQAVALISGPWAPRAVEQRANAFAAMLLVPDKLLEQAFKNVHADIHHPKLTQVVAAAKILHVSPITLARQLENRGWIDQASFERIMSEPGWIEEREFFVGSDVEPKEIYAATN